MRILYDVGSVAGAVAQMVAYPLDTVKKRLQIQSLSMRGAAYNGILDCFQQIIATEGMLALYRGTATNLVRIIPHAAIMFGTYEWSKETILALDAPLKLKTAYYDERLHRYWHW
jgi:hypothetical protein